MNKNNNDNNTEAVKIANALKPFAKKWFDEWGKSCLRSKKMTVSTAPNGTVIGVKDAFSDTEIFIKYMAECSNAQVGDTVWCKWMYDNMQTLYADSMGNLVPTVDYVPTTGGTFTGDVAFDGVLDVTQRRCYDTLSSAGWYRVCTTRDISGTIIEFNIGRPYGANPAEAHRVLFYVVGGGKSSFIDETSISNTLGIDKIRATYGGDVMHIDLHYSLSTSNEVLVYFDVRGKGEQNGTTVSNGLQAVADAPSGESTVAEHQFYVSNKPINVQDHSSLLASGTIQAVGDFSYEASEPCWVYLMFVMQANSSGRINIKVDNVDIVNWTSGEAIPVNFAFIPIPLMRGNTLYVAQSSNRASTYKIFAMR